MFLHHCFIVTFSCECALDMSPHICLIWTAKFQLTSQGEVTQYKNQNIETGEASTYVYKKWLVCLEVTYLR